MTRAVVWKELREQGLIALSLVALGSGVLVAAALLADPPAASAPPSDVIRYLGLGRLATLMLAVTAGMVCGGAVFAAEREAGTMSFLESLPASRWHLWRAKLLAGLALAAAQITLLVVVAAGLGFVTTTGWAVAVVVYSFLAFAWGVFGSTTARTTLGSVGLAIPVAILTAVVLLIPVVLFFQRPGSGLPRPAGGALFLVGMFVVPVGVSAWLFTRLDRDRAAGEPTRARRARPGLSALQWLTVRQAAVPGVVISGFALLFGLVLLVPTVQPILVWPELALVAGILAGVTAFADEQTRGAARYWGEQRLPLGRMWAVKIGLHLLLCLWLLVLLAAPLAVHAQVRHGTDGTATYTALAGVFRSLLFDQLGRQGWNYLLVPAAYGFAAGHLAGLVFRKLVVACGVAAIVGGVGVAAWVPSLLSGGVRGWQLWLPPLVALLTGRLLMRPWTSDRLATRAPLGTLIGGCAATLLVLAAGLGYRVLEVPDRADGEADVAYVAGLLPFDQNVAGRDFRTAAERFARVAAATSGAYAPSGPRPAPPGGTAQQVEQRLATVVARSGWPADDPNLGAWLDRLFSPVPTGTEETAWHVLAAGAAAQPVGIYEYPQSMTVTGSSTQALDNARRMAVALLARGLQLQAAGDPAAFLPALRVTLALVHNLRNGAGVESLRMGNEIERTLLAAVDRWLALPPVAAWTVGVRPALAPVPGTEAALAAADAWCRRVTPAPDLLREAIGLLEAADTTAPFDPTPHFLAERFALRELQKAPGQWLQPMITPPGTNPDATNAEVELVGLGWAVPWERERTRRLIGLGFETGPPNDYALLAGRPGAEFLTLRNRAASAAELTESDRVLRGFRRAAALKLALRAFKADHGHYPDPRGQTLAGLVTAGYLRRLPADPHDNTREIRYRLSEGEALRAVHPNAPPSFMPGAASGEVVVRPGQAILWSVGPDGIDEGGRHPPAAPYGSGGSATPGDLVYLVPDGPNP